MIEYLTMAIPENVISREHIPAEELANFERVVGIKKTRRWNGTTSDMIKEALRRCDFTGEDIKNVIVVTQSPDRLSPCMAMEVHHFLRLPSHVPAFDVNHACDGYILGLYLAQSLDGKTLLICADRLRYNKTPIEGLIFSDSVSITVVNPEAGKYQFQFLTEGQYADKLYCGVNGEMEMDGASVFDFVTTKIPPFIKEFVKACDMGEALLVPHQANLAMNRILEMRSGFKGSALYSIEEYGNMSMNSIPMCLTANEDKIKDNQLIMVGFGAGYSAAICAAYWPGKDITWKVEI